MYKYMLMFSVLFSASLVNANPVGGPKQGSGFIVSQQVDTYTFYAIANQDTTIMLHGNGHGDLDCFIYNSEGVITFDDDSTSICELHIYPSYTRQYVLTVQNVGEHSEFYTFTIR
jgi:hypothetical protein